MQQAKPIMNCIPVDVRAAASMANLHISVAGNRLDQEKIVCETSLRAGLSKDGGPVIYFGRVFARHYSNISGQLRGPQASWDKVEWQLQFLIMDLSARKEGRVLQGSKGSALRNDGKINIDIRVNIGNR